MSLHFMPNVDLRRMTPQAGLAMQVASEVYAEESEECLITSVCRQGTFAEVGLHGDGNAVDLSVRRLDGTPIEDFVMDRIVYQIGIRIGKVGGGQYDVVDERPGHTPSPHATGPHIHVEYDPK
jgi:hypothetical protein